MSDTVVPISNAATAASSVERAQETALLIRVRDDGDRDAFSELFNLFSPRLRAYARRQGADADTAESVVQDVMVTAWTRARLFDADKSSARTWMYTLVRNRLIDGFRAEERKRRALDTMTVSVDTTARGPDALQHSLSTTRFEAILGALPDEQVQAVLMAYVEGKSHREIAQELAVPTGTIKSRTRLALQRLRKLLEVQS